MPCNVSVRGAFQLTPSVGRATSKLGGAALAVIISIHALREEGDFAQLKQTGLTMQISIHALREEGDTVAFGFSHIRVLISIHALREEGDLVVLFLTRMPPKFQSTPSARRATVYGYQYL